MDTSDTDTLNAIDSTMLAPLVRRLLNRDATEMMDWQSNPLFGAGLNSKIVRFSGNARDRDAVLPWSLILKIVSPHDGEDDPVSLRYWKREALAFQSGLLDDLPGKIRAPRCYGVVEQRGPEVWLWLEDVLDDIKGKWLVDQYGNVARHVGEFNGMFFENTSAFSHPWMTKGQLRSSVGTHAPILPPNVLAQPLVARFLPKEMYEWMQEIWLEHTSWLDFIEHQPQTLSHLDVFRRNSFARVSPNNDLQTALIDWAFVGRATPGEEIAPLVAASLNFLEIDSAQAHMLDQIVFSGYLEGLRSTGWQVIHASSALPMPSLQC